MELILGILGPYVIHILGAAFVGLVAVAFWQGREISFWPPKIGALPKKTETSTDVIESPKIHSSQRVPRDTSSQENGGGQPSPVYGSSLGTVTLDDVKQIAAMLDRTGIDPEEEMLKKLPQFQLTSTVPDDKIISLREAVNPESLDDTWVEIKPTDEASIVKLRIEQLPVGLMHILSAAPRLSLCILLTENIGAIEFGREVFGINDFKMSHRHFKIEMISVEDVDNRRRKYQFVLKDLGSTNGTFRNGERVSEVTLSHGDRIEAGRTSFRIFFFV